MPIDPAPSSAYSRGMTIELTREQEQFIEQALSTGHFSDKGEVIEEALTLLKRQGEVRAELQADIQEGLDDLAAGRARSYSSSYTTETTLADDIKKQGRTLKAKREQTAS
jgi:putative addiction module CopG family antidote